MTTDSLQIVTVEKLVEGGWGLAHRGSEVLLLRGVIPGERASVTDVVQRKGYHLAKVDEILEPSSDRVAPPCPVYGQCGGCQLQHLRYEAQLTQKAAILKETLSRIGKVTVENVPGVVAAPDPFGYRSVVRFVVCRDGNGFKLGFHQEASNNIVATSGCLLVPDSVRELCATVAERLARANRLPLRLESIEIRRSVAFGSCLLVHRAGSGNREDAGAVFGMFDGLPGLIGQVVVVGRGRSARRWVSGQDWLADRHHELTVRICDRSFVQAHWHMAQCVSDTILAWAAPSNGMRVLELYAGIGMFGLPLARGGALVTEVEANPYALADARHTAKINHVGRCRFRKMQAEAMLEQARVGEYDLVLVDPPRTGLSQACLGGLVRAGIPRMLYLSCSVPTLARDLGRLSQAGYRMVRLQPFDMFPQTAHLETLVELVR